MPDLIAQGIRREQRWRRRVTAGEVICVGRAAEAWSVPWDDRISRNHINFRWDEKTLHVESLPGTQNPVFFQGVQVKTFRVKPGEHFVIGQTTFTLTDEAVSVVNPSRPPMTEQTFSQEYLRRLPFRDPGDRLDIISKLPERLAAAVNDADLFEEVIRVVFAGVPLAHAVAICRNDDVQPEGIAFLYWDSPDSQILNASRRLIAESLATEQSVVHTWDADETSESGTSQTSDVERQSGAGNTDETLAWAFCVPVGSRSGTRYAIYVAGKDAPNVDKRNHDVDPQQEMKFVEIVASTVGSIRDVGELRKRQAALGQFFSAPVVKALESGNAEETLAPREVDVTVLFCDLRGFSRATEQYADDLLGLLQRVSDALGALTKWILHEGGVIGDFHGDAAMGFWGWPIVQDDAAIRAANAALRIFDEFRHAAEQPEHSLKQFRIGVGIASGRVVAGKIGTVDQVKVTAFGPAVNLASRLEGMTKWLNAAVLVDSSTAARIRAASFDMRLRKLAVVQPYGMQSSIEIHQLLAAESAYPLLTDQHIRHYESALDAFIAGDWKLAWEELHNVPAADPSKDFLTTYIASRNRIAPENWDGVIRLDVK